MSGRRYKSVKSVGVGAARKSHSSTQLSEKKRSINVLSQTLALPINISVSARQQTLFTQKKKLSALCQLREAE